MCTQTSESLPSSVPISPAVLPDRTLSLTGKHVTLVPLSPSHISSLYTILGGSSNSDIYTYMPSSSFLHLAGFTTYITDLTSNPSTYAYAIYLPSQVAAPVSGSAEATEPVGIIVLEPTPAHARAEIGAIFSAALQRTIAATESFYLLLSHAFSLHYQRVEWKCDSRNEASCRAAKRLGFSLEGTLRKHMLFRGRRDTCLFSLLDEEWGVARRALYAWLGEGNFEGRLQRRGLESLRKEFECS